MWRSNIRDSVLNGLASKVERNNYAKYLKKIILHRLRGFSDQSITFNFPVTAVIGPNGGGKTTVLGAAACCYKTVAPKTFFAKSGIFDSSMQGWTIEYEVVDKASNPSSNLQRTANFRKSRWRRGALDRMVLVFAVSRTVPANERAELAWCMTEKFNVSDDKKSAFNDAVKTAVRRILGKDISNYISMSVDDHRQVSLLVGATRDGVTYSEFHFGAGESSIIRMVAAIEASTDFALILIEEIENGLHPVATRNLVEYLIDACERKKCQVIFTTHSNVALDPLPPRAVWVATQDRIFNGKPDIISLRALTGEIEKECVVFVEDNFAKLWIEACIRSVDDSKFESIELHAMEGDGTAVATNKYHNKNPAVKIKSVCYIDGDSNQKDNIDECVFRLPGSMPEIHIFEQVLDRWPEWGGKLSIMLYRDHTESELLLQLCRKGYADAFDKHLIFANIAGLVGFLPENTVSAAFCAIWAKAYPNEAMKIVRNVLAAVPISGAAPPSSTSSPPDQAGPLA